MTGSKPLQGLLVISMEQADPVGVLGRIVTEERTP